MSTDWEVQRLGDIASFFLGSGLSKGDLSSDGQRRCIHYGELFTTYGERITEILHGTNREGGFFLSASNDVLMPTSDVTPDGLATASCIMVDNAIIGGGILVIRAPRNHLNGEFLAYIIKAHRNQILQLVSGTTVFHIYGRDMASFRFAAPNVQEQTGIVEALSDVDTSIRALDSLINKKRLIKQAVMQQLLTGKVRLDGFGERWEMTRLGHVAHIRTGSKNNQDKVDDGEFPFFVRSPHVERIDSYSFEGEAILIPGEGDIGSIFHYVNGRYDVHQRVYNVSQFAKNVCGKFLYYSMTLNFGSHAMQNTVKATVDSLRLPTFKKFRFPLPTDIAEQRAIAAIITDLDAEIGALEARRDKYLAIKQGMMQQLLTGRVRLVKSVSVTEGESAS